MLFNDGRFDSKSTTLSCELWDTEIYNQKSHLQENLISEQYIPRKTLIKTTGVISLYIWIQHTRLYLLCTLHLYPKLISRFLGNARHGREYIHSEAGHVPTCLVLRTRGVDFVFDHQFRLLGCDLFLAVPRRRILYVLRFRDPLPVAAIR